MLGKLARTVFGSANDRFVKKQYKIVQRINALEPEISPLSDEELKAKTEEFKQRLKNGETLGAGLPLPRADGRLYRPRKERRRAPRRL